MSRPLPLTGSDVDRGQRVTTKPNRQPSLSRPLCRLKTSRRSVPRWWAFMRLHQHSPHRLLPPTCLPHCGQKAVVGNVLKLRAFVARCVALQQQFNASARVLDQSRRWELTQACQCRDYTARLRSQSDVSRSSDHDMYSRPCNWHVRCVIVATQRASRELYRLHDEQSDDNQVFLRYDCSA